MGPSAGRSHPCISCGACCAHFRVSFYWREAEPNDSDHPVPKGYFEELNERFRVMAGTQDKHHPKCIALEGRIGLNAKCSIYLNRPTPCRNFKASYSEGVREIRCEQARRAHGLRPLTLQDWTNPEESDPNKPNPGGPPRPRPVRPAA